MNTFIKKSKQNFAIFVKMSMIGICFNLQSCSLNNDKNSLQNIATYHPLVELIPSEKMPDHLAYGKKYMVSSQGHYATLAGNEILAKGGNVIDAAVAVSFAIGVERPQSTGIGGGGFLLYCKNLQERHQALKHGDKLFDVKAFDFREKAPQSTKQEFYLDQQKNPIPLSSQVGSLAVATPGMVAGLYKIHQKFGKLPWSELLKPAIKLAREGFDIYPELATALEKRQEVLAKFPSSKKIFFHPDGSLLKLGDKLIQTDLSHTMETIAQQGAPGFYHGKIAQKIIATLKSEHVTGILSMHDFATYQVKERPVLHGTFHNFDIYSMPPPSSGGVHVLQILNLLEQDHLKTLGPWNKTAVHLTASAMQQAFADRATHLGDPDFSPIPVNELLSKSRAEIIRRNFSQDRAKKKDEVSAQNFATLPESKTHESSETTHFSIMDMDGNVVSSTQTINDYFGSGIVAEETGIVLNNEMDDFALAVGASNLFGAIGGQKNLIEPYKRPLSSMSPTIVLKKNVPIMTVGSPSGTRIITCVAQTLLNYLAYEMDPYSSVALFRYHQQWSPDELWVEEGVHAPISIIEDLKKMNYPVVRKDLGCKIQAIMREGKKLVGVSDPRGRGFAAGI